MPQNFSVGKFGSLAWCRRVLAGYFKVFVNLPGESLVIEEKTGIIKMVLFAVHGG
jgi:hypothetical protein